VVGRRRHPFRKQRIALLGDLETEAVRALEARVGEVALGSAFSGIPNVHRNTFATQRVSSPMVRS